MMEAILFSACCTAAVGLIAYFVSVIRKDTDKLFWR